MNPQQQSAQPDRHSAKRRGIVIVAVLLVVVLLSLAAYQYADLMVAEAQVMENVHRAAQTRAFAESGIHYTAALLSNPNSLNTVLNGNPYDNQQAFYNIAVQGDNGLSGRFSIIAPADPTNSNGTGNINTNLYGVTDETGKINLVSWMQIDPTGQQLFYMLSALPNMTPQIAYNIIAWMGGSYGISNGGAQDDYYQGLTPPYRCKNNVPDSLDELLMVQGVTRDLLYGADANRNGVQDGNEPTNTTSTVVPLSGFDRGWSAYLTIYSREQNSDVNGNAYMWLNNTDLQQLYSAVSVNVDPNLAKFIVMYRQYGPASSSGGSQSLGSTIKALLGGGSSSNNTTTVQGNLSSYEPQYTKSGKTNFTSFFQLVNVSVNIQSTQNGKTITTSYASPLNSKAAQQALLPLLFQNCTLSQNAEIPARINVNTAPQEILMGLQGVGGNSSGLADTDVNNIIQMRQQATGLPGDIFATPAWLLTEANISPTVLQALDMNYITTRSQVYRVQSVGYFDNGKGPAVRIEAVIDTQCPTGADPNTAVVNPGRPRIIAWRNLSDLGKGWTDPNGPNANANMNP